MDPVTAALLASAGTSAATGIAQYLNSSAAQGANQDELNQLKQLASQIQQPNFNVANIPPAQLQVLQQYAPSIAQYVPQKSPQLVSALSTNAQQGQNAQLQALQQNQQVAKTGTDPLLQMAQQQALNQASQAAGSEIATANQRAQQQGMAPGGGMAYAAQLSQAAGAQNALANAGIQNAAGAYERQAAATNNAAQLGGQLYNQDVNLQSQNANTLNQYNQNVAQMGNAYNQYVAGQQNQAQQYNLGQNQSTANQNVANQYSNAVNNRNYANQQAQQGYQNALTGLNTQFGLGNQQMNITNQGAQNNARALTGLSDTGANLAMGYANYNRNPSGGNNYNNNNNQGY